MLESTHQATQLLAKNDLLFTAVTTPSKEALSQLKTLWDVTLRSQAIFSSFRLLDRQGKEQLKAIYDGHQVTFVESAQTADPFSQQIVAQYAQLTTPQVWQHKSRCQQIRLLICCRPFVLWWVLSIKANGKVFLSWRWSYSLSINVSLLFMISLIHRIFWIRQENYCSVNTSHPVRVQPLHSTFQPNTQSFAKNPTQPTRLCSIQSNLV